MAPEPVYAFGHFRLLPERRSLLGAGQTLKLGGRAYDVLLALVQNHDRVLTRDDLMRLVWPRLVVEESNLNVQILMLRKLLGHPAIATVPGRGYRFALPVTREGSADDPAVPAAPPGVPDGAKASGGGRRSNLPSVLPTLYGRDDAIAAVTALLSSHRLVTVVGSAGIGKTRVAEAVAARSTTHHDAGVWWVGLASITTAAQMLPTIANVLGLETGEASDPARALTTFLRDRHLMLVLDNCEHLVDAVAAFVEALWSGAPRVSILVTSQESLKTASEQVYRLDSLALPMTADVPSPGEVAASGAGALFLARARAVLPHFALSTGNVAAVCEICRRLDGIPLAIELAAARLPLIGIEGLRSRLNQRFNVLTGGARAVLRRHQTLQAAIDWSHELLTIEEKAVFRRLGVFAGGFTLESAQRVASDDGIDEWDVLEHLGALVDKSLVIAEGDPVPRYKLLETTRMFALECLADAGETEATLRSHATAMVALIRGREAAPPMAESRQPDARTLAVEGDNVRVALDWLQGLERDAADDDRLAVELGGLAGYVLAEASGLSEALERTLALQACVNASTPPELAARFWGMVARNAAVAGRIEGYEAAVRAAALYRELDDPENVYRCLTWQIAIGARRGEGVALDACVDEARRLERPHWSIGSRGGLRWACYRLRMAQGRIEEARASALERARLGREEGLPMYEHFILGDNVADCEIALGRTDEAVALCRDALTILEDGEFDPHGTVHVMDTYAVALAIQGKPQEAIDMGRRALRWSRSDGFHFRMLEPMAISAAALGRLRDAAWAVGHVDAAYASRGEVRWPHVRARRDRLDALLAEGLDAQELRALKIAGATNDLAIAFERAFGESR